MDAKKVDLKDFIRNFVNKIPKDRGKNIPLICMEFSDLGSPGGYSPRIYIYGIESLKIIRYKYSAEGNGENCQQWSVPSDSYEVVNLLPPIGPNKRIVGLKSVENNLGVIQVGNSR